jgi:fucose 4-O-acetylase-like acetyltransferase
MIADPNRHPFWDNNRLVLIVLVVFGHLASMLEDQHPFLAPLNAALTVWRMPLMAFVAGTFARAQRSTGWQERLVVQLLLPYVILQVLFGWYYVEAIQAEGRVRALTPLYTLWFLLALFWWHLCLPWVLRLRHPLWLALGVALLAGCFDGFGERLSASRAMVFFPLFLLGHLLARGDRSPPVRLRHAVALGMLVPGLLTLTLWGDDALLIQLARGSSSYGEMGFDSLLVGAAARLLVLLAAVWFGAALLSLVPLRRHRWTALGERTLYIYLLHGVTLRTLEYLGVFRDASLPWALTLLLLLPPLLAGLLASEPVMKATRWAIEGRVWWAAKAWRQRRRTSA